MLRPWRHFRALVIVLSLALVAPLLAEQPVEKKAAPGKFIRVQRNADKEPTALETAIVRYVPASGEGNLTVDLVSVVHIGDKGYYQKLNKEFENYDVVLYELVAPEGTRIPKGGKREGGLNPLAMMQQMMKMGMNLESQTELIDYTKKNFVHADMSPDQIAEAMKKRGDDPLTLILSVATEMIRQQNRQAQEKDKNPHAQPDLDPLTLLLDPDGPNKLKKVMATQMEDLDGATAGLGQTLNTILITDRNGAAMKVFAKELANGKKKIAIFYGAAHMPDFEKRLRDDFGLKRGSEQWFTAWDLQQKAQPRNGLEDLLKLLK